LVALVGANGAGKSTVARLMLGLYRPEHGRLLADGVPYDELDLNELRRRIGLVPQDPLIFPATIAENVAYGIADPSTSVIRAAAELAGAASFVEALPRGYETFVGDDGVLLSGGQRQQLALARALIAGPSLLVLDEPTTYLDGGAKRHLFETLGQLEGTTILVISHDDAVAGQAERAYELAAGRAVETGVQLA